MILSPFTLEEREQAAPKAPGRLERIFGEALKLIVQVTPENVPGRMEEGKVGAFKKRRQTNRQPFLL